MQFLYILVEWGYAIIDQYSAQTKYFVSWVREGKHRIWQCGQEEGEDRHIYVQYLDNSVILLNQTITDEWNRPGQVTGWGWILMLCDTACVYPAILVWKLHQYSEATVVSLLTITGMGRKRAEMTVWVRRWKVVKYYFGFHKRLPTFPAIFPEVIFGPPPVCEKMPEMNVGKGSHQ